MKKPNLLVSIVITAYNEEQNIEQAVQSALSQTILDDLEIVVIDDGSSDSTASICKRVAESHNQIHFVQLHKNCGHVAASMTGIEASHGKYFIRLDGDDIIYPELTESLLKTANEKNSEVVIGGYVKLYSHDRCKETIPYPATIRDFIMCGNLIKRDLFLRSGGLRNLRFEEYDCFLRLAEYTDFTWNRQALYEYRIHDASYCHRDKYWETGIKELLELWPREVLEENGFSDLLCKG